MRGLAEPPVGTSRGVRCRLPRGLLVGVGLVVVLAGCTNGGRAEPVTGGIGGGSAMPAAAGGEFEVTGEVAGRVEAGGASTFDVRLPAGVAAQAVFAGGAGHAIVDGITHTGIGGGTTLATPGWDAATDRYRLDLVTGVSSLTLDRLPS